MKVFIWKEDFNFAVKIAVKHGCPLTGTDGATVFIGERVTDPNEWVELPLSDELFQQAKSEIVL